MSNKIGVLSDIHGNYDALEAVIKNAKKKGINNFIFCGDLVGYYYEPKNYNIVEFTTKANALDSDSMEMLKFASDNNLAAFLTACSPPEGLSTRIIACNSISIT